MGNHPTLRLVRMEKLMGTSSILSDASFSRSMLLILLLTTAQTMVQG
jgi:hypothetical protein